MYAVVNLGAFAVAALVARTHPGNRLGDYRGLYATRPLAALAMGFFLLCLAGLPPGVIGLFAKVTVFSSAVDAGLGWLAVVMAVNVGDRPVLLPPVDRHTLQDTGADTGRRQAPAGPVHRVPAPVTLAIALTAVAGITLSGAPQLILRFATLSLF